MVEEEVQSEVLASNLERNLAAYEGEADTEFDQELPQVAEKSSLQIALLRLRRERQEVEVVWILQEFLCEVRLRFRKRLLKVRDGFSLPPVEATLDLEDEHVSAPSVLNRGVNIPKPLGGVLHEVEQADLVPPRNLSNNLLDN